MARRTNLPIALPRRWQLRPVTSTSVLVHARAVQHPPGGVPPEVVLARSTGHDDLETWRGSALADLADRLVGFDLEDEDRFDLEGHRVHYCRFAHRLGTAELLSDQWAWLDHTVGHTLTGTVAREQYADYCDVFETIAASFDPELIVGSPGSVLRDAGPR